MDPQLLIVLAILAIIIIGFLGFTRMQAERSKKLRERFGPEYERTATEVGDERRAESVLEEREKRVKAFEIRPLPAADRDRYAESWRSVQAQFVDDPAGAITEADRLVSDVMQARGYPVGEFEERASDISVDHPTVVENYRTAHGIAQRHSRGEANTEDLRKAMVHYRTLFDDLLESGQAERTEAQR
jgi:FtsZ-interacting cell division protein ZipA